MTAQRLRFIVPLCTVIAFTCACSKPAADVVVTTSANPVEQLADTAEKASAAANEATPGSDALKPNERVQGTIQLDIGKGAASFRSIATKVDDDLGKKTAERLASTEGQSDLAGAKSSVSGGASVSSQDIQETADIMAGKTIYTSQMNTLSIANLRAIDLAGSAADGRRVTLNITFGMDSDTPTGAKLEYTPDGKKQMQSFVTDRDDKQAVQVTLDRFERVNETTLSIAGSFKAGTLKPSILAKDLTGQEIAAASGSFDFTEVNIRPEK